MAQWVNCRTENFVYKVNITVIISTKKERARNATNTDHTKKKKKIFNYSERKKDFVLHTVAIIHDENKLKEVKFQIPYH